MHNIYKNEDFQIKGAKKIIIEDNPANPSVEVKGKQDKSLMKIPLHDLEHLETVTQRQYLKKDTLIEIIFTMDANRLRIIRLDVADSEVHDVFKIIKNLAISHDRKILKLAECRQCESLNSNLFSYCPKCGLSLKEGTIMSKGIGSKS